MGQIAFGNVSEWDMTNNKNCWRRRKRESKREEINVEEIVRATNGYGKLGSSAVIIQLL